MIPYASWHRTRYESLVKAACAGFAMWCGILLSSSAGAVGEFDAAAFKAKVATEYTSSGSPVLVEQLAKEFVRLKLDITRDRTLVRNFYSELLNQIASDPLQEASERAYLEVLSIFLAGRDVWSTANTIEATNRLGKISNELRQSKEQADAALVAIVDDAISKADNMYIAALRVYDPRIESMKALIERQLIPLLDYDYVMASRHSVSIRAMIAIKYAELALLEANYDDPICSEAANLKKDVLDKSNKYAQDLLRDIEVGKAPPSAVIISNDLIYHLQQVAALSCDRQALMKLGDRLVKQQPVAGQDEDIKDQIYVFRHLRTKRTTTSSVVSVDTDEGEKKGTEYKPDQSDVVRSFFSPWQLSMYLCKTVFGSDDLSINQLKAQLNAFENVDFWVNVGLWGEAESSSIEDLSRAFEERRAKILIGVKRRLKGEVFGTDATHKVLTAKVNDDRCGSFQAFPSDARVESVISTNSFRMIDSKVEEEPMSRFRIGGFFSYAEAKAVRDTLRDVFGEWSVTLGRPRIQD